MDRNWFALSGFRRLALKLTAVSAFHAGAVVAQALFLAKAISLLFAGSPIRDALGSLLLFVIVFFARQTLAWLQQTAAGSFAELHAEEERERFISAVFSRGPRFAAQEGGGELTALAMEGPDKLRVYLELAIFRTIDTPVATLVILLCVFGLDCASGIILSLAMPVIIAFFIVLGLAARKQADRQWQTFRRLAGHFADTLRGLETLLALGVSREHGRLIARTAERYRHTVMKTLRIAFLSSLSLDIFSMLAIAGVAVGLGFRLIDGSVVFERALAVLLLAPEFFVPIRQLGADYHASLDGKEAWKELKKVSKGAFAPNFPDSGNSSRRVNDEAPGTLTLNQVVVSAPAGEALLKGITLDWTAGAGWIGIAGASGAGKTTLLGVIGGLIEASSGEMLLDGRRMEGATRRRWLERMVYLPQHPHIFSLSLADNIRFYEPSAGSEEVERAIRAAGLEQLVRGLPHGIDEPIGEGGRQLSGGEAQRVALARALVSDRPIVLLDEPTAHLDMETEWDLKQTLLEVLSDKRVIIATHRLHWMKEMKAVWVMEKGRVVEVGTHEELRRLGGIYGGLLDKGGAQA
ncbi:thiol reductant ABC exporter subunit CydD [Cohnella cellulosilytica]|uniref:Thiol reductant ABC exporter subunit CydD n=1 Tax=Cohnella cellulosilytica TaxID=986710 RepID=A0ABW2FFK8_9BACL